MNVYQEIQEILLEKTPFIIETQIEENDQELYLYQDVIQENAFARISIRGERIRISIDDFVDWDSIHTLLKFGKNIVDRNDTNYPYSKVIIEYYSSDMDKDFIYEYRFQNRPWYFKVGYFPYYVKWSSRKIKTLYQLPFMKPDDFLDLPYAKEFICPKKLIYQKQSISPILMAQKDPTVHELRMLPQSCFYSGSRRPLNSMNLLRQDKFQALDLSKVDRQILKSGIPFAIQDEYYIPVVRYALGMRNGCYFDPNPDKKWLGTFYYWEPESECYLKMGSKYKFGFFETKLHCAMEMLHQIENEENETCLKENMKSVLSELRENFYKFFEEEAMYFENKILQENDLDDNLEDLLNEDFKRLFCGKNTRFLPIDLNYQSIIHGLYMKELFYASEDVLDQVIARCLIETGYNVAIFGRMAGSYRIVSEVLDVRSREESLKNLCWTVI
jgi:hypothetical protein